jgi:hypothetical protein
MSTTLTTRAKEQSTYVVTVAFTHEGGGTVTPTAITWTLSDADERIINSRQDISVAPSTSISITLTGSDLQLASSEKVSGKRFLTIEATYNSSYGSGLYMKDDVAFYIDKVSGV